MIAFKDLSFNCSYIRVTRMLSIGDDREEILNNLRNELTVNDIVITTGGLGPTKDDITKGVLAELSGSAGYVEHAGQLAIIQEILHSRGLDMLAINRAQALVPDRCEVIENRLGTAPIMVFRFPEGLVGEDVLGNPGYIGMLGQFGQGGSRFFVVIGSYVFEWIQFVHGSRFCTAQRYENQAN